MTGTTMPARRSMRRRWTLAMLLVLALTLALPVAGGAQEPEGDPADQPPDATDTRPGRGGGPRPNPKACERAAPQSRVHDVCAALSSGGAARADYDGDGFTDLAIGVPGRTVSGQPRAGLVYVVYGSADGLTTRTQILWQGMSQAMGPLGRDHRFGAALAGGDFNGDGVADLAVGVPGHNGHRGSVKVLYGIRGQGLSPQAGTFALNSQENARFGSALVWGDFNSDGRADLAMGVPQLDIGGTFVGAVWVLYGSTVGLTTNGAQFWWQEILGPASAPRASYSQFGSVLAAGDVGRSAHHDLVIGAPFQPTGSDFAGAVHVLYGGSQGLSTTGAQRWHFGLTGASAPTLGYGLALAVGDFSGTGVGDLAIGAPYTGGYDGLVHVLHGTRDNGLTMGTGHRTYMRFGPSPDSQQLGNALAAADFNGDGRTDLAIGAPRETVSGQRAAGAVYVLHGSINGLVSTSGVQRWHQGAAGLFGSPTAWNQFGSSLTAWNWGRGTQGDLAVGVPGQTVSGLTNAGAVQVLYGTSTSLSSNRQQYWHEGRVPGAGPEAGARFGSSMY